MSTPGKKFRMFIVFLFILSGTYEISLAKTSSVQIDPDLVILYSGDTRGAIKCRG